MPAKAALGGVSNSEGIVFLPPIPAIYENMIGIANPFASRQLLKKNFQQAAIQVTLIIIVGSTPNDSI
jgi:hypothetical protein